MQNPLRKAILTGGILNLFMSLFHLFLCYQIFLNYRGTPIYPLLEMLSIGGTLLVIFLAYTSLALESAPPPAVDTLISPTLPHSFPVF